MAGAQLAGAQLVGARLVGARLVGARLVGAPRQAPYRGHLLGVLYNVSSLSWAVAAEGEFTVLNRGVGVGVGGFGGTGNGL